LEGLLEGEEVLGLVVALQGRGDFFFTFTATIVTVFSQFWGHAATTHHTSKGVLPLLSGVGENIVLLPSNGAVCFPAPLVPSTWWPENVSQQAANPRAPRSPQLSI